MTDVRGAFEPLHKAHAIDQVAMAVAFDHELNDQGLNAARDVMGKPEELPGRTQLRGLAVQIGPTPSLSVPGVAGYGFTKVRPDGFVETELHIQRSSISFRTLFYTRWANVWQQCKKYFDALLPIYMENGSRLMQVSLNYVDKFVTSDPVEECRPADILKTDSPYLCPTVFSDNDLWHCHSGKFQRLSNTTKRLTTINVDFVSENVQGDDRRAVVIVSVIADWFNQATYDPLDLDVKRAHDVIESSFESLHKADKVALRSIISDRMAKRIALGPQ